MRNGIITGLVSCTVLLTACDTGPNGYGTAPSGVSQADWDAKIQAQRQAEKDYMHGPRGGSR
jgi:hypothetical protein